jgi:RNA polymerase sigma-70 factor (ECF subfamily)
VKRFGLYEHLLGMTEIAPDATVAQSDLQLAVAGDEVAFARLVAAHHAGMARVAYAIAGDRALAEDALQSAWVIAWRKLGSVRDPGRIRAWLMSIAVNEARQILRRRRRAQVVELNMTQPAAERTDPQVGIGRVDLVRALGRLSADDRALIALRYVLGFDTAEIGQITGRSASGTRTRLSRVTARLREELGR